MSNILAIERAYSGAVDHLDLELILAHVLKKTREFVLAHPEYPVNDKQRLIIDKLARRRIRREPLAYILKHREFYGLEFSVNQHTLIPRPETELLVELALKKINGYPKNASILDIGTGSGNVIVSLAHSVDHKKNAKYFSFYAIDISGGALKVARQNAMRHGVAKEIKFLKGDLLETLRKNRKLKKTNILIIANLPYLSSRIYASSAKDVRRYEPKSALYSPSAGLGHYFKLLKTAKIWLNAPRASISLILEISPEQKKLLRDFLKKTYPRSRVIFHKDLAGRTRACEIDLADYLDRP